MKYGFRPLYNPTRVFAIGDVHGNLAYLKGLWEEMEPEFKPDDHLVFLGDLTDRGTHSPEVVEFVQKLKEKYPGQIFVIRGNHEWMLEAYMNRNNRVWLEKEYSKTLEQFKVFFSLAEISPEILTQKMNESGLMKIYSELIPYYETPHMLCTHAPLDAIVCSVHGMDDFKEYLEEYPETQNYMLERMSYDLMWKFTDEKRQIPNFTKFRVCGHQFAHHKQPRQFKDRIYLDTGCGDDPKRPLTGFCYPLKKTYKFPKKAK